MRCVSAKSVALLLCASAVGVLFAVMGLFIFVLSGATGLVRVAGVGSVVVVCAIEAPAQTVRHRASALERVKFFIGFFQM